jgi:hypothetical protein
MIALATRAHKFFADTLPVIGLGNDGEFSLRIGSEILMPLTSCGVRHREGSAWRA